MVTNQRFRFGSIRREINVLVCNGMDEKKAVTVVLSKHKKLPNENN